jgi:hypothetical protein
MERGVRRRVALTYLGGGVVCSVRYCADGDAAARRPYHAERECFSKI